MISELTWQSRQKKGIQVSKVRMHGSTSEQTLLSCSAQDDDTPLYLFDHAFGEYPSTRFLVDQYQALDCSRRENLNRISGE